MKPWLFFNRDMWTATSTRASLTRDMQTSKSCIFMNNPRPCLTDTLRLQLCEHMCLCAPPSPSPSFNDLTQWSRTQFFSRASGVRDDAIATTEWTNMTSNARAPRRRARIQVARHGAPRVCLHTCTNTQTHTHTNKHTHYATRLQKNLLVSVCRMTGG